MEKTRLMALALVLVVALATATPVAVLAVENQYRGPDDGGDQGQVEVVEVEEVRPQPLRVIVYFNTTLEKLVKVAYDVRNVSMPIVNWALNYNVTLGEAIIKRGDWFLERALNESSTGSARALAHAMVAAIIYSHAPVTAYPVLARVLRENLGENETITDTTVRAVCNLTLELKSVLSEAENTAVSLGYSVPNVVRVLEIRAESHLNASLKLLEEGFVREAFREALKAYHTYVLAYSKLLKSMLIRGLRLGLSEDEPLTQRLLKREVAREALERVAEKLPRAIRERVMERIRAGEIRDWRGLREAVRAEVEVRREQVVKASVETVAGVMTSLVMYIRTSPMVPGQVRDAVNEWLRENGFTTRFGVFERVDWEKLREYFKQLAGQVSREYGVVGLELLSKTVTVFQEMLRRETGVEVNLQQILAQILVQVEVRR